MIMKVMMSMLCYFGDDVRRINHALKVYGFAKAIAGAENLTAQQCEVVETAALLHDIGIKNAEQKYQSSAGNYQELEGPPVAREILLALGMDEAFIERVCFLVGHHHSYGKIDGLDFRILVESDFLVNCFEDGMTSKQVEVIKEKYFVTETGKKLICSMYAVENN